jgi:hypothetical protein
LIWADFFAPPNWRRRPTSSGRFSVFYTTVLSEAI